MWVLDQSDPDHFGETSLFRSASVRLPRTTTTDATYQTSSGTVVLSGTATDEFGIARMVIENDQIFTFNPVEVELIEGQWEHEMTIAGFNTSNVITVRAWDDASNEGTATITITRI
jgi:hypothetical protein